MRIGSVIREEPRDLTHLKHVLRRIEQDVERESSLRELVGLMRENRYTDEELMEVVDRDMIDRVDLLNRVAIRFYEEGLYDHVIPLLDRAHRIDPANDDTLYNLGYILISFGQHGLALEFLRNIRDRDADVEQLISLAEAQVHG